jgi:sorbose reductase
MARVPEMTFCAYGSPASPTAKEVASHKSYQTRFSLEEKSALGQNQIRLNVFALSNRCVVTGGARGLGLMIGRGFLEHGLAKLALFDVDQKEGDEAAEELLSDFPQAAITFTKVDVTDEPALRMAVTRVANEFDGIHVLATFAGTVNSTRAIDYTPESFRKILDVNTTGTFLTAQAVGRYIHPRPDDQRS